MNQIEKPLLITGPCALESEEHAKITVAQAKQLGINVVRLNLWKPRTTPGFEGVGVQGLPWLDHAIDAGLTVAMEVLIAQHVDVLMKRVLLANPHSTLLVWIGSRNQNHIVQQDIGSAVAGEPRVKLMLKNQPWRNEDHWIGIAEHVQQGGASKSQLLMCHRGFAPQERTTLRNPPDWEMAERVKKTTDLPMIIDPSHIGGRQDHVMEISLIAAASNKFDGQVIEVHPEPWKARTDAPQQLDWDQMWELHPSLATTTKRE